MVAKSSTIDGADVARFEALGAQWWSATGPMGQLHRLNPLRVAYIRDLAVAQFTTQDLQAGAVPLNGLSMLDIGCGGGILCEPLARLGARMRGIDPGPGNIEIARLHAQQSGLEIDYAAETAEHLAASGAIFDVVLAMEVIEHVTDVPAFLRTIASMVRPGGLLVLATLNRTPKSFALAIVGAEYVLGWLPRGTHTWSQFVQPEEIRRVLSRCGMRVSQPTGVSYSPLRDAWQTSRDWQVNYMISARRPSD